MKYLFTSSAGVRHFWRDDGGGETSVVSFQDGSAILERNRAMASENDGYTPSRDIRRVASIPLILVLKWLNEEGWYAFDPNARGKLKQKLNDPEYRWLRTAPGRF
jgi:hypothetical protein